MEAAFVVTEDEQVYATVFDGDRVIAAIEVDDPDPKRLTDLAAEAIVAADRSLAMEVAFALKAGSAFEVAAHFEANV